LKRLDIGGGEIEFADLPARPGRESGPALVFLHEGLGSVGLWRSFPEIVAGRTELRTITWSRHGYGGSDVVERARRVRYMHDEALEVLPALLSALDVGASVLIGHSDGASIALIHAGAAARGAAGTGGGAAGAIGGAGGAIGGAGGARPVLGVVALAPHVFVEARAVESIEAARNDYAAGDLRARLDCHHADPDAAFWGWNDIWLSPQFRSWNIEEYLPGIRCQVLLVQCEDDQYGTLEQLDRIERGLGGPSVRMVFPTGGHSPHLSHPEAVAGGIAAFVAGI
jgi:pimeloyl-ACP methyl ester carboxylesterase